MNIHDYSNEWPPRKKIRKWSTRKKDPEVVNTNLNVNPLLIDIKCPLLNITHI